MIKLHQVMDYSRIKILNLGPFIHVCVYRDIHIYEYILTSTSKTHTRVSVSLFISECFPKQEC